MPFVQRVVEPKHLARSTSLWTDDGRPRVSDCELQAVTNSTLSNALRQLASLVLATEDIFAQLGGDLQQIARRSQRLKEKMGLIEEKLATFDPKKVTVPESDISTFALLKKHYSSKYDVTTNLFSAETRPSAVRDLYEAAAKTPVHLMRQMDKWRRDGHRSSKFFLCTPVLGRKRRIKTKVDIDIETSMPAAVEELRRWTSNEALGDITVTTDCQNRIPPTHVTLTDGDVTDTVLSDDEAIDHKLPSPEEQQQVIAMRFPPELVSIDISGRHFDRMSFQRRSLLNVESEDGNTVRRKTKSRRSRSKRRNTLAGTDEKEIVDVLVSGDIPTTSNQHDISAPPTVGVSSRSKSSDILRSSVKKDSPETKKSHFDSLKQWGKNRLKILNKYTEKSQDLKDKENIEDINLYETVTIKRKRSLDRDKKKETLHQRQPSGSSTDKSSIAAPQVKLRDSSLQRRLRRSGGENKEEPHSSSGNWSASSESGRASIGSEITTHPKSTTSAATSSNSLNIHPPGSANSRRRYNINTSTSGSCTSEGTLTPDIIHDLHEDGETSSVYSCDTEGYYTSFHVDSGLKTLREEDGPQTPIHSTTVFTNSSSNTILSAENEYELFGKGSTSTTTSSAGTVCTTLRAADSDRSLLNVGPAVPERKSSLNQKNLKSSPESSLERDYSEKTGTVKRSPHQKNSSTVALIHKSQGDVSPDSGHNSSPIESANSPNGARSCSEFEFSETSDVEGERVERIRVKTTINSSRIPSMCAITPPISDDESVKNFDTIQEKINNKIIETNLDHLDIVKETNLMKNTKIQLINVNPQSGYATIETIQSNESKGFRSASPSGGTVIIKDIKPANLQSQPIFKSTLLPLNNMIGKIKTNWNNIKKQNQAEPDYVTIAEKNNNDMDQNLKAVLSGKIKETEYVSLNELPIDSDLNSLERKRKGARVTLNADGKVVYSSDSLPRRKGSSTFEPGPFVKDSKSPTPSPIPDHRNINIRPVNRPMSPQLGHQLTNEKMMETDRKGQYNTLPSKKASYLNEPDITKDLGRKCQPKKLGIPVQLPTISKNQTQLDDSLRISPIDPRTLTSFKSSTPSNKSELKSAINLENKLLSPKKSTMSNDELYAVIHKSKKKLNIESPQTNSIENQTQNVSVQIEKVQPPETGYFDKSKSRLNEFNLSPKNEPRSRHSWAITDKKTSQAARLDFKRLLLQHCRPNLPPASTKLSAVEQLKLSKPQIQPKPNQNEDEEKINILDLSRSPRSLNRKTPEKNRQPSKILSPRSQWRFASPRSDVLSSTILEDHREDDSPNNSAERKKCFVENNNVEKLSISEKMQAKRAQFFNSSDNTIRKTPEKPLLPTLETAF
ncbi:uncharacterized protein [Onthophagus taurus]|uniref:uncharacterized protein isoform X2 n=1 Tax=Onthophagus taurus TaxID=166361 RepID=UPI0039BDE2F6